MNQIEPTLFKFIWKYSRRDQLILLVVTSCLFPLLYLTLELPKRIINDAIGAQSERIDVLGYELSQVSFLALLCAAFLAAVLAHGLVKMRINTMKGVLAERMLRRFRYQLIARIFRFPQPYFERVSQGELVSMITAESEPMGGLMGDAISQPVLQAGQMLTILGFLFLQSFWFGVAACALIPLQAWLIPKLQRQINLLNKKRVAEVRVLAADIGESAAGITALRANGGWRYRQAMISAQLGRLFAIRFEIYQKKFFMKFLNNFISQLTPFFFFSIGGYLVLQGAVSLGALVAALAAYKDLSSPWKELLAYYNQTQDMAIRWEIVTERFAPQGMMEETRFDAPPEPLPRLQGDVVLDGVTVRDADGNAVLEDLTATLPMGKVIGVTAPSGEDRRALAEVLTREVLPASGRLRIGETDMAGVHQAVVAARIGHANSRPHLFQGSFGDNVMMAMKRRPSAAGSDAGFAEESLRAGNSADPLDVEWLDPELSGFADTGELRAFWASLIEGMGQGNALIRRGLDQKFDAARYPELSEAITGLRERVRFAVSEAGLERYVHRLGPDSYNPALPVAENLLFASPRAPITADLLVAQSEFLAQMRALNLDVTLLALTRDVIDMLRQIFGMDGTDHPLFRALGLDVDTYEHAVALVEQTRETGAAGLSDAQLGQLLIVPAQISADQIGPAFPEALKQRILDVRHSHSAVLTATLGDLFVPLAEDAIAPGLTVLENALFGKMSQDAGARADDLRRLVANALAESGANGAVLQLIYALPIALSGGSLSSLFAEPLALSRAAIKRPDVLILETPLASYPAETRRAMHDSLRRLLPDTTLIYLADSADAIPEADMEIEVQQGRIVRDGLATDSGDDGAATADLGRKLRALEQTALFSTLSRKQLRLLAFGARWFTAQQGETVFLKDDAPTDGAYLILEGEAGMYLPSTEGEDKLIVRSGPGTLVGELGLIRNEPRALSMVAESDLRCLRIGAEEFLAVVENDAATAFKLLQVVAGYVRN